MMKANLLLSALVLLAISKLSATAEPSLTAIDRSFMKYMMTNTFASNAQTTKLCFDNYINAMENVAKEFSENYQRCTSTEKEKIEELNDKALSDRRQIELAADDVCVNMDACNDYENTLDFLDCYSGQGSGNTKVIYGVTQNSTVLGSELRETIRLIEVDKERCQNASERAYIDKNAATYKELEVCLGTEQVPSTPSSSNTEKINTSAASSQAIKSSTTSEGETSSLEPEDKPQEEIPSARFHQLQKNFQKVWKNK